MSGVDIFSIDKSAMTYLYGFMIVDLHVLVNVWLQRLYNSQSLYKDGCISQRISSGSGATEGKLICSVRN